MNSNETAPYSDKYIWKLFAIAALLLSLHFLVYEITISEEANAKSLVAKLLNSVSSLIPSSENRTFSHLPYEIPRLQLALSLFVTLPLALILLAPMAKMDLYRALQLKKKKKRLSLEHALFDVQLFTVIGILMMLLLLLIPPSSIYIGAAKNSFFGVLAPIKYASCSYVIANLILILFQSFRVKWR